MRKLLRVPFVTGFFLLLPSQVEAQQPLNHDVFTLRPEIPAELVAGTTTTTILAAWSIDAEPSQIASANLGGDFSLLVEQSPSLTSQRRTLVERTIAGYPISGEVVRVNWLVDGSVLLNGKVSEILTWSGFDAIGSTYANELAVSCFPVETRMFFSDGRLEILPLASGARLCHRIDLLSKGSTSICYRVWVDAEFGHIWRLNNRTVSSTGQAAVFMPNPVETLDNPNLTDQNDSGTAVPAAAYFPVSLIDLDGSGTMTGTWATTAPTPNRSFRANLNFTNNRNGRIFEEALSYYHVTTLQHHMQALGLTARQSVQPINVVDRLFGFEYANASYNPSTGVISFGTRGVDFAEDADVVIHEYGHAIHDDVQGGLSGGFGASENGSMSEGYGDWFSAVHSDDAIVGEWVGVSMGTGSGFPAVRRVDGMKHYPEDKVGEVHVDGEIWSSALWEIALMIGHDEAIQLVIEAMSMMSPQTNMPTGANLLVAADNLLSGGVNRPYVAGPLLRTGFIDVPVSQPLLEADRRGIRTGDVVNFRLTAAPHAGRNFQMVLSRQAIATATGAPFNVTLDIGTDMLGLSIAQSGFAGQLDALGVASFSLVVPP